MSFLSTKNNAHSLLASGIDDSDPVDLTVTTGEGAKFSASNFPVSIEDEILLCTSRTGDVLTCDRAQEETVAAAHGAGATVKQRITAEIIKEIQGKIGEGAFLSAYRITIIPTEHNIYVWTTSTGTVSFTTESMKLTTGASSNSYVRASCNRLIFIENDLVTWDRNAYLRMVTNPQAITDMIFYVVLGDPGAARYVGLKIVNSTAYVVARDSAGESTTEIGSVTQDIHEIEIRWKGGVEVGVKIDGGAEVTHSSNLPTATTGAGKFCLQLQNTAAATKTVYIYVMEHWISRN